MKEITLSDGTKVKILKGKGRDYALARRLASQSENGDIFMFLVHLLTEKENGEKFTVEELEELPAGDYMALESGVFDVNPLPESLKKQSSSSSEKASPIRS